MDWIKKLFLQIKQQGKSFLFDWSFQLKFFICIFLIFCITMFSFFLWNKKTHYIVLYKNLSTLESQCIKSRLQKMHIPYQLRDSSKTLLVPEKNISQLHFSLMHNNHDQKKRYGLDLLDQEKFGISQFHEQVNYHRGLEGELSETLERIFPIQNARIHLVFKKDTDFFQDSQIPSASVVLTLLPNTELKQEQIDAITLLVSSSVPNLSFDHIVLVNQSGVILNKYNLLKTEFFNENKYKKIDILEEYYCNRIKKILTPLFGLKNLVVNVQANVSFYSDSINLIHKKTPLVSYPTKQLLNNSVYLQSDSKNNVTLFNVLRFNFLKFFFPNFFGNCFINNDDIGKLIYLDLFNIKSTPHVKSDQLDFHKFMNNLQDTKLRSNDLKQTNKNDFFPGFRKNEIKNFTITILVNYKKNKSGIFVPLSNEELKRINLLTKSVINFSKERGDRVNIINFMFNDSKNEIPVKNSSVLVYYYFYYLLFFCLGIFSLFFVWFLKKVFLNFWLDNFKKNDISRGTHTNIISNHKENNKLKNNNFCIKKVVLNKNPKIVERVIRYWIKRK
ncbi:flagellar basal-body MS-ring/collar protein FliF [Buchnera aphidicola]|uniref:Flagellar M-ring protein n=1 Tax=Buchnera aphidicola (Cinara strobi) TaxID=1921549 RepID=A0A3B1E9B5_9GAMM|nr:flagellar basal-body MS-ring/collar protein FliF [Buchnera aphidicola]VAX76259.1 Flagellar M-ring protein [Buchnera aphidicola (Cinara strobi)]